MKEHHHHHYHHHPDAQLIERSLSGDTEAFGGLVAQYQSLICAVTYSRCGDYQRSQELAQETFVTAWKNLQSLQDRGKFKAWLCGIARNLARSAHRSDQREPAHGAAALEEVSEPVSPLAAPDADAIHADEGAVVWRALQEMPESYREPMVLYYREDQSVERVAEALDLTRDAVKQRLSRGRVMLKARVASVVEASLVGTRPGPAFTIAVVTALPLLAPSTASAAVLATTAKGSAAAKSAAGLAWIGPVAGSAVGLLGAWIGLKSSLNNCQSEEERRAVKRMAWWGLGLMAIFAGLLGLLIWRWGNDLPVLPLLGVIAAYVLSLFLFIAYWTPKLNRLRREHAPLPERQAVPLVQGKRSYVSRIRFLGLPLVHCVAGGVEGGKYRRATARGWIAMGDVAISPLLAAGGLAVAPLAFGGCSIGLIPLGGLSLGMVALGGVALGVFAYGGVAIGWWAFGGAAVGGSAAMGGVALARDWALGAPAGAAEANTEVARAWFADHPGFALAEWMARNGLWVLIVVPLGLSLVLRLWQNRLLASTVEGGGDAGTDSMTQGWVAECSRCGYARPLGGIRLGATSYQKRTLGFCPRCRFFRWVAIRYLDDADPPNG